MPIQFAQKPPNSLSATATQPQSPSARSSPSVSPRSTSSSSASSPSSSSVVAILSGHSAISVSSGLHVPAAASTAAATTSRSVLHHHLTHQNTKCAKMTEEGDTTTATIRNGLSNGSSSSSAIAAAATTGSTSGLGTLLHTGASAFRYAAATGGRTTTPPSSGRRSTTAAISHQNHHHHHHKVDLTQKSKSANDLLLDVVGSGSGGCTAGGESSDDGRPRTSGGGHTTPAGGTGSRSPLNHAPILGGRLQFFKDGKFILELATSGDGDRSGWVSVPQKTYWPPMAAPTTTNGFGILPIKNESSTSISFSDDNSSVQSSPWQRDHCWKQTNPRKHISTEMALYFQRPSGTVLSKHLYKTARLRRRRPYMPPLEGLPELRASQKNCLDSNAKSKHAAELAARKAEDTRSDGDQPQPDPSPPKDAMSCEDTPKVDEESTVKPEPGHRSPCSPVPLSKNQHSDSMDFIDVETIKSEPTERPNDSDEPSSKHSDIDSRDTVDAQQDPAQTTAQLLVRRTAARNTKCMNRRNLQDVLQHLIDCIPKDSSPVAVRGSSGNAVTHLSNASTRMDVHHQQHVSPRKRILRELEKVSLEDHQQTTKRSRAKPISNHSSITSPATAASRSSPNHYAATAKSSHFTSNSIPNGIHQHSSLINGSHTGTLAAPAVAPVSQATSRPISSYSITSLLGHNSQSSSSHPTSAPQISSSHLSTQHPTDPPSSDYHRKTPSSPKSPNVMHFHNQTQSKPPTAGSAFSSATRKKSPTLNTGPSCLSPVIGANQHSYVRSPSLNSPINYGGRSRSPDLSPSPEQTYSRYRHASYSMAASSASSPNSSHYHHPYLPTSSSRASPSGALSPPTDISASHRYRYGSPIPPNYSTQPQPSANTSSPMSYTSRYSPSGSYSQMSPQHYGTKQPMITSPPYSSMSTTSSQTPRARDPSPNGMPPRSDLSRESTASSYVGSSSGNGNHTPRTVPKKTAALRHAYTSPTSSPSHGESTRNGDYMKASGKEDSAVRKSTETSAPSGASRSRSPTPAELQRMYEKEQALHFLSGGASIAGLSELEINAGLIRAGLVPPASALQQHQQQAAALNMYRGMYMLPPNAATVGQMSAAAAAAAGFLQPVYYPSMGGFNGAAAYRSANWMLQAQSYPPMQHPNARFGAANPLLAAAAAFQHQQSSGAAGLAHSLAPPSAAGPQHPPATTLHQPIGAGHHQTGAQHPPSSHMHPLGWEHSVGRGAHASAGHVDEDEPVSLVKSEQSSDVPLNLSKH